MKDKTTTAILAFFLGGLGVHRFYLGDNQKGLIYLIFCWTFIPAIVVFFDAIAFLIIDNEEFDAKYNNFRRQSFISGMNVVDELEKMYQLKERGIITEAEFQYKKDELS